MPRISIYILCLVAVLRTFGADKPALSNADIVKMVKAELPESTVVLAIQNGKPTFDLSPDALIALKSAGVTPAVINAMLGARSPAARETPSPPTEDDARRVLRDLAREQSKGVVTIEGFTKTDGQASVKSRVDVYRMDFQMFLRFSEDCIWLHAHIDTALRFNVAVRPKTSQDGMGDFMYLSQNPGVRVPRGTVYKVKGYMLFERTENGWSPGAMERSTAEPSTDGAVAGAKAASNSEMLRGERLVSRDDFAKLLESTLAPPTAPPEPFESKNGKVHAVFPAGFKVEKGNAEMVGRFSSPTGVAITVTCSASGLFNRYESLETLQKDTVESIRRTYPGARVTEAVDTKLAGVDAKLFGALVVENGVVSQKAITVAVCKKHALGVLLHSPPDKFESGWPEYRRVCEAYVLNVK